MPSIVDFECFNMPLCEESFSFFRSQCSDPVGAAIYNQCTPFVALRSSINQFNGGLQKLGPSKLVLIDLQWGWFPKVPSWCGVLRILRPSFMSRITCFTIHVCSLNIHTCLWVCSAHLWVWSGQGTHWTSLCPSPGPVRPSPPSETPAPHWWPPSHSSQSTGCLPCCDTTAGLASSTPGGAEQHSDILTM